MFRQNNVKQSKLSKYFQNEQNMFQNFYFINVFLFFRNHFLDREEAICLSKKSCMPRPTRWWRHAYEFDGESVMESTGGCTTRYQWRHRCMLSGTIKSITQQPDGQQKSSFFVQFDKSLTIGKKIIFLLY